MDVKSHPVATPAELLPSEVAEWLQRWRSAGMTLDGARAECRRVHADIARIRGATAGDAWWDEMRRQSPRLA